jgi:hypothetical protein
VVLIDLVFVLLLLSPGAIVGGRRMVVGPATGDGVSALGAFLTAVDAGLLACPIWVVAMLSGLGSSAGPQSLVPPALAVFGSAWLGAFLLLLGFRANGRSRQGPLGPVLGPMGWIVLAYTGAGTILGTVDKAPLETSLAGAIVGVVAAALATLVARRRITGPEARRRVRPPASLELGFVRDALPGTLARGGPVALLGCALAAIPVVALAAAASTLRIATVEAIPGFLVTGGLLALLALALAPVHAVATVAFTTAARGERPALGATLRRALALVPRIVPVTFLLLSFPLLWHLVLAYTGHRAYGGCTAVLLATGAPPVLALATRYVFLAPALASGDPFSRSLRRAQATARGRGVLACALVLGPVLALMVSPFHEQTFDATIHILRGHLQGAGSDGEAWLVLWRTLAHALAGSPLTLAAEIARVLGAVILGSAIVAAGHAAARASYRLRRGVGR